MRVDRSRPAERVAEHLQTGRGVRRIAYPIKIREPELLRRTWVTERMVRLTLGGPELDGTHTYAADDHVKVIFPHADGRLELPVPNDRGMLDWPRPFPVTRSYTIRRYDAEARELDLDFVVHDGGLASAWATTVIPGATVPIAGPPGATVFASTYEHYVLIIDSTALPAVARWLEGAPRGARVDVVAVIEHRAQREYPLDHDQLRVSWLDRPPPAAELLDLADDLASDGTFLFAAGESDLIKPLRSWVKKAGLEHVITGYWKRGVDGFDD